MKKECISIFVYFVNFWIQKKYPLNASLLQLSRGFMVLLVLTRLQPQRAADGKENQ